MNNEARTALERIAHVLNTAQVRWEGDTVMAYISALVTAGLANSVPSAREESPKEAFEEGMRIGRLGYKTIEEIISADERLAGSARKAALQRARAWVKKTLYVNCQSPNEKK